MTALLKCTCGGTPEREDIALGGYSGPWTVSCHDCGRMESSVCSQEEADWWWNDTTEEQNDKKEASRVNA